MRHEHAHEALGENTNPNAAAQRVPIADPAIVAVVDYFRERAMRCSGDPNLADEVRDLVRGRLDAWFERERRTVKESASLSYAKANPTLLNDGLVIGWNAWSAPNSLRDVEREVNLLLDRNDASMEGPPGFVRSDPPLVAG